MKASPTRNLTVWERFNTALISVAIVCVILTIIFAITHASAFMVLYVWIVWGGTSYVLSYMGKESPYWSTEICLFVGAFAPIIFVFLLIVAYLPGNVTRFKYRTK